MTEESSEDWLPPGWTVEVRVRKHGKRDKYYFAPSSGLRFNSRAEVSRYLNTQEVCNPKPEPKIKDTLKRSARNVVVEKAIAEGLPPGWIKEIRVTKKGHKIRRDPFYIDPVSGYIFHSMKDVLRYLETGELGRLASKPKDIGSTDVELEDDNIASPAVAKKQKSVLSSTREQVICDQSSKWDVMVKDEQIPSCTEKCVPLSGHISDQSGRLDTDLSSSNLPEAKVSEQIEGRNDSAKSVFVSAPAVGLHPANQSLKSKGTTHENEKTQLDMRKSKSKKEYNLPRRASKRLAGLDIGPTPELKTSRARRFVKQPGEAGASTPPSSSPGSLAHWASPEPAQLEAGLEAESNFDDSKNTKLLESINSKRTSADMTTPGEHAGKIQENKDEQKPKSSVVLPVENLAISEQLAGRVGKGNEENEKPDIPVDLPSMDLWSDPCIQFAIKTLTGEGIDSPKSTELSSENKGDKKQGCSVVLPLQGKVEENYRDYEKPGSPLNMAFSDSWMDPCIEFAVKTLTGAIPVDCVLDIQDSFHSQQSSSQTQASSSGLTSSNVGFNKFCQTGFLGKKIDTLEKPSYRHQALVEPVLQQTGNVSLQNSATTVLHRQSEGRVLLEAAARFPFFQVGQIFQKFECRDQSNGGVIRNVVRWSIPTLLEEQEGATLLVSAKFTIVSVRNIYLQFEEITVQNIKISEELQALIAPAILPRSFLSLQILQFIRDFRAQIPVRDPGRQSVGGLYYLSYLDDNMLLGRAVGGGGVFVFTRAQPLD